MRGRERLRAQMVFSVPLFILLCAVTTYGIDSAKGASTNSCGWDTRSGWVARENAKVGNANWAKGIPPEYSGDYLTGEKGVTPPWGTDGWLDSASGTCGDQIGLHLTGNYQGADLDGFNQMARCLVSKN
jgi:hypothetical protein